MKPAARVAVLAKAPTAGLAKTRLIPALGAERAAALAAALLGHAVDQAVAAQLGPVTLWGTPDVAHPAFMRLQQRHGIALARQRGGDLGERMAAVFETGCAAHGAAPVLPLLLIGADLPGIDAACLVEAAARLHDHDAVFVPAQDGGYGLVGLSVDAVRRQGMLGALFSGMSWSTAQVMADTRLRLAAAGLCWVELPPVADIDEAEDLRHLPDAMAAFRPGSGGGAPT